MASMTPPPCPHPATHARRTERYAAKQLHDRTNLDARRTLTGLDAIETLAIPEHRLDTSLTSLATTMPITPGKARPESSP